ncbi:hypothetical protein [Aliamphritea ceti]|uniref:hypothetical protein n=1 Tax=Aliamphritea ceti TaxID=1524258 RepID=UPI0021C47021|nr:hypothetical protein [Aliamphritea ceti]
MPSLTQINDLPAPQRLHEDLCWFHHHSPHQQTTLLVYAIERDFLSAPKSFAVVELSGEMTPEVHQMHTATYLQQLDMDAELTTGLYGIDLDEETDILLLLSQQSALEVTYQQRRLITTLYHCSDSQQALLQYLRTD